jgi:hypothetical protein
MNSQQDRTKRKAMQERGGEEEGERGGGGGGEREREEEEENRLYLHGQGADQAPTLPEEDIPTRGSEDQLNEKKGRSCYHTRN